MPCVFLQNTSINIRLQFWRISSRRVKRVRCSVVLTSQRSRNAKLFCQELRASPTGIVLDDSFEAAKITTCFRAHSTRLRMQSVSTLRKVLLCISSLTWSSARGLVEQLRYILAAPPRHVYLFLQSAFRFIAKTVLVLDVTIRDPPATQIKESSSLSSEVIWPPKHVAKNS